jgi:hypothetical protein
MTRIDNNRCQLDFTYFGDDEATEAVFAKALIKAANRLGKKYNVSVAYGEDSFNELTHT